ncbi:hypothetical protein Apa02nite_094260 [Actinoplanes palleronii]|uniref:DUF3558 domain-containing protein n=2 Tax=Actinoplanes palleronii TaxID=113570 RepID=A0ABQ4BRL6_9ACTN|nr:hypothetical protein Apa02nite_094260 [Actinoplanes palleronii]
MVGLAVSAALLAGAVVACAAEDDSSEICSKRDVQLAKQLNDLPILDARPASATPTKSGSGCDASNGQAYATRSYRSPLARTEIVAFYEAALVQDGWQARPNSAVPPGTTRAATGINCYFTKVDGQFVHFAIPSSGSESANYILEVNGQGQDGWASSCTPE